MVDGTRKGVMKDVIIVVLVVASLLAGAGYFAQRTVAAVLSLDGEQSDFDPDFAGLVKVVQQFADKALPSAKPVPPPAAVPKTPEPAAAAKGSEPKAPEPKAAAKKVELTTVSFFEGDKTAPPMKDRIYTSYFNAQARYIYTEVVMKNNYYKISDTTVAVSVEYYDAAGQRMIERKLNGEVKKEWNKPSYTAGFGLPEPGIWKPGQYTVRVYLDGELVGTYGFTVE